MFYEESEINKALICPCCNLRFEEPKVLPCGNIICGYCASRLDKQFQCELCAKTHVVPDEGFPISSLILKLLSIKSDEVIRSYQATNLKSKLKEIQKNINGLSFKINNGIDFIKEHCINLRNDVQLATERIVKEVNDLSETMINKINKYEQERINDYNKVDKHYEEHLKAVNELQKFYNHWNVYLNQFKVDDHQIDVANNLANKLNTKSNLENTLLDKLNFSGVYLKYENNLSKINTNVLGQLFQTTEQTLYIDSFKKASFKEIFSKENFQIDRATNDNYLISYSKTADIAELIKINQRGEKLKTFSNFETYPTKKYANIIHFKSYDNFVILSMQTPIASYLKILGTDLKQKFSIQTDHTYSVIAGNDSNIFCLIPELKENNLIIYDSKLQHIKTIGKNNLSINHFPNNSIQLENTDKKYFVLQRNKFSIIDQGSGVVLISIYLSANKFYIVSNNKIIFISYENKTIEYYDFDGRRSKLVELCNTPKKFSSFVDFKDRIYFYDKENEEILY